jgi:hypothetical protein
VLFCGTSSSCPQRMLDWSRAERNTNRRSSLDRLDTGLEMNNRSEAYHAFCTHERKYFSIIQVTRAHGLPV